MDTQNNALVAVLLATYNGARFVEPQIRSLRQNSGHFVLHWLDDHSTDQTRQLVRAAASSSGIELREWHQSQHLGVPAAFFQLLELVDADIYLFCDQDDIWQAGKIDATVSHLLSDLSCPALCFSDPLMFNDDEPGVLRSALEYLDRKPPAALQESRVFTCIPAAGHTIGFTRALREIFLRHKDIAHRHAFMHDWWMYLIAVATGTADFLSNVPTTLYRQHVGNVSNTTRGRGGLRHLASRWQTQQRLRRGISRQAEGFILASETLIPGPRLVRLVALARHVATLDRRQSPMALLRLARCHATHPGRRHAAWLAAACLCSDARL